MLPVLPPPIEYAVPSAEVKVPAAQATVSASVTEKTEVCVQPIAATFIFPRFIIPLKVSTSTDPPEIVILEKLPTPALVTLATEAPSVVAPHQVLPSVST